MVFFWGHNTPPENLLRVAGNRQRQTPVGALCHNQCAGLYCMVISTYICSSQREAALLSAEANDLPEQFGGSGNTVHMLSSSIAHSCGSTDTLGKIIGTLAWPACQPVTLPCAGAGAGAG